MDAELAEIYVYHVISGDIERARMRPGSIRGCFDDVVPTDLTAAATIHWPPANKTRLP